VIETPKSKREQEEFLLIQKAKKQFDYKFFSNFAYSGPSASQLSQRDLEEHI